MKGREKNDPRCWDVQNSQSSHVLPSSEFLVRGKEAIPFRFCHYREETDHATECRPRLYELEQGLSVVHWMDCILLVLGPLSFKAWPLSLVK